MRTRVQRGTLENFGKLMTKVVIKHKENYFESLDNQSYLTSLNRHGCLNFRMPLLQHFVYLNIKLDYSTLTVALNHYLNFFCYQLTRPTYSAKGLIKEYHSVYN